MNLPRPLRVLLIACAGMAGAMALSVLAALYLLLQPDRFTRLLQTQANQAGLQLTLSSPASPTLFPRPALQLVGITLAARDSGLGAPNMPILLAANGRLVLPWRSLFGGPIVISRLQIDSPRVDLDALQAWLTSLPPKSATVPEEIPSIVTGVRIRNGSVVEGDSEWLSGVSLDTGRLAPSQPFWINLSARENDGTPLQLQISSVPSIADGTLLLSNLQLRASDSNASALRLSGQARWWGAAHASIALAGKFYEAGQGDYDAAISLSPATQHNPLLLRVKLLGKDNHIDLELPPLALAQWWNQMANPQGPMIASPPGNGQIEMATLDVGKVHIEGLSIQTGNAVPANASSAAAPAQPAGPHPL
ncbi:MAG TPA: membrane assembly protein AsmA [Dyella sp.]|uniref:membrane assembly protein AsmA n=1 Tax=Dyella sp. TaxID=1869338 RepID=UPI002CFC7E11|nr:membrane assembly protein AsmA [Dyella sp.]HTV87082.1 membrane assembly protein AsmA [Dyella sp.]